MLTANLPSDDEMYRALVRKDPSYDGVFLAGITSTGIFCRPVCPARKPRRENVRFFGAAQAALAAGFRPCLRCRPLARPGSEPAWLQPLLAEVERDPQCRLTDADLRALELDPVRVRRWFRAHHGLTFHAWLRARRLVAAQARLGKGDDLLAVGFEHGFDSTSGFRDAYARLFGRPPGRGRGQRVLAVTRFPTPLGPMVAAACDEGVALLEFADRTRLPEQLRRVAQRLDATHAPGDHVHLARLVDELEAYFDRRLVRFGVPLAQPGTDFQRAVWTRLRAIPHGETLSYEALARDIGHAGACRAVGRANGDNPLAIVVPCHRVVGADGRLTGYGGGLWRKQALLDHERGAG